MEDSKFVLLASGASKKLDQKKGDYMYIYSCAKRLRHYCICSSVRYQAGSLPNVIRCACETLGARGCSLYDVIEN